VERVWSMTRPWMEFRGVDASGDPDAQAAYLKRMAAVLQPIRETAMSRLEIGSGSAILDAGCGLGEVAIELSRRVAPGGWVAGIDASEAMIERARAAAGSEGIRVDFSVGSITALPFPDATFDVARSERVFQHLDATEREAAAAELLRVVKPGGVVQLIDPNHRQWAVAATDRDMARLVTEYVGTRGRTPEAGLLNGGLLRAAGAVRVDVAGLLVAFDSVAAWSESLGLEGWIEGLIEARTVSPERAEAFFDDLARRERDGVFSAVGVTYIATGRKPA
jgi:SAM-dependent methyltransferase